MTVRGRLLQAFHPRLHYLGGNQINLLCNGNNYFSSLPAEINHAQQSIRLETYLYADDSIGNAVTDALCRAANRGVNVRLVVDGFGARNFDLRHRQRLEKAGIEIGIFRPEHKLLRHVLFLKRARLRRMHRKLALIDGHTAFAGGINIIDDATGNSADVRMDFALRIRGPLIQPIGIAIDQQWLMLSRWNRLLHRKHPLPEATALHTEPSGAVMAALALRDNLMHRRTIEEAYLRGIRAAREKIIFAMAYFIPSQRILTALLDATRRGVQVTLLLQGQIEYRLQHHASQALYGKLLAHGVKIYEYQLGFMHAKAAMIDGKWSTVGSANLDPFSLLVAREANIVVRDKYFAATLHAQLNQAIHRHSHEITATDWAAQPGHQHLFRGFCARLISRLLSMTGYAANY